jgi:ribose-phosphate pyrophosphokinase
MRLTTHMPRPKQSTSPKTPDVTGSHILVASLPGGEHFAPGLAHELGCEWSRVATHSFPDGETLVRYEVPLKGRCVVLACSLSRPDTSFLPLAFAADAARDLGAAQVGLVAPYLAYMRQDKRFHAGEAVASATYARLLSSLFDWLVTVDPHLHRIGGLDMIYAIPTRAVSAAPAIARWIATHVPRPLVVGPDSESGQWVAQVARLCAAPSILMSKRRDGDREVEVDLPASSFDRSLTPVLVDDILSTGQTAIAAAAALRPLLAAPVCIGVHALLARDAAALLVRSGIASVVTCDTVAHPSNGIALAGLLAPAVAALQAECAWRS